MTFFENKSVLITGGTGSLGKALIRQLRQGAQGTPSRIVVFSRDEEKQYIMQREFQNSPSVRQIEFHIGDIRDYHAVCGVLKNVDIVFNAAALKQVPSCEYVPYEAVRTNIDGAENIVRAIEEHGMHVETVIGISTDKACKPVNTMGMTKAIQERIFIHANMRCPNTRFICVRYGNVLATRGSVVPLFQDQVRNGGPVTITSQEMTRFILTLEDAVATIFAAGRTALPGEVYIPNTPAARVVDIATAVINNRPVGLEFTGIRPGEKLHEVLISEEEAHRTVEREPYFVILPLLPEMRTQAKDPRFHLKEYTSQGCLMSLDQVSNLLRRQGLVVDDRREMIGTGPGV